MIGQTHRYYTTIDTISIFIIICMYKVVISVCLPVLLCPIITLDPITDLHQNLIKEVDWVDFQRESFISKLSWVSELVFYFTLYIFPRYPS